MYRTVAVTSNSKLNGKVERELKKRLSLRIKKMGEANERIPTQRGVEISEILQLGFLN